MNDDGHVLNIKDEQDFENRVIARSSQQVVAVDFWAPWCAPCRALGPVLEQVVKSFQGKAVLAKVNVDENQALAAKWQVRSIPVVKLFKSCRVAKEFVGALPEHEIRRELSSVIPSEADDLVAEAEELVRSGDTRSAENCYRRALEIENGHASAIVRLARISLDNGNHEEARHLAESVSASADEYEDALSIIARVGFLECCKKEGGRNSVENQLAKESRNLDLMYAQACCFAAEGRYEDALEQFMRIIEQDKHYQKDAPKSAMVRIFAIVGERNKLADDYRERLTRLLYS
jgi:putative thioredoxin